MDEPLRGNFTDRGAQQAAARSALNELSQLADDAKQWRERYTGHSNQVLNFINEHTPANSAIFDMLEGIEQIGKSRFDGRIPPGFQDRGKKSKTVSSDDDGEQLSITTGSNKLGDLMFWKEVLGLAAKDKVKNIVLLTNDVKNDWQLGGRVGPKEKELFSLRQNLNPIPLAHPMLSLEASLVAKSDEVLLIDSVYLGIYLKRHADKSTASFIDVAIVPDSPATTTVADHNRQLSKAYKAQERELEGGAGSNYLFVDNPELVNTRYVLVKAWRASAKLKDAAVTGLLERIGQAALDQKSAADLINEANIGKFTNDQLVSLGRLLHDHSLVDALGGPEIIVDLVSLLDRLPVATAASLHLGLLGSMYFNPGENTPRLPPRSTASQQIYASQGKKYAEVSIEALTHAFSKLTVRPLYLLQKEIPKIVVELRHLPDADGEFILDSIKVNGAEVYSASQKLNSHNLRALFHQKKVLTVGEILDATARVYLLPRNQLENDSNPLTEYEIPEFGGFNSSDTIFNN